MYTHITEIRNANERLGHHFFEDGNLRFFRSRIGSSVYGGRYFITSEQFDANSPRLYTIREAKPNGRIDTVGEFQQYASHAQATRAAKKLAGES